MHIRPVRKCVTKDAIAGPDFEGLFGAVLPGGADRFVLRADGIKAIFEMQADTGGTQTIRNDMIVDEAQ